MTAPTPEASNEKLDKAVIAAFAADLDGMTRERVEQAIREAQDQIDEIEPWLESLHAYRRLMPPPSTGSDTPATKSDGGSE